VAINALYALMHRCKVEAEGRSGEGAGRWRRRQETVLYTLLTHHLQASDFNVVLQWLERLLDAHPTDLVRRRGCGEGRATHVEYAVRLSNAPSVLQSLTPPLGVRLWVRESGAGGLSYGRWKGPRLQTTPDRGDHYN
jgi:hypothetical protein